MTRKDAKSFIGNSIVNIHSSNFKNTFFSYSYFIRYFYKIAPFTGSSIVAKIITDARLIFEKGVGLRFGREVRKIVQVGKIHATVKSAVGKIGRIR